MVFTHSQLYIIRNLRLKCLYTHWLTKRGLSRIVPGPVFCVTSGRNNFLLMFPQEKSYHSRKVACKQFAGVLVRKSWARIAWLKFFCYKIIGIVFSKVIVITNRVQMISNSYKTSHIHNRSKRRIAENTVGWHWLAWTTIYFHWTAIILQGEF